MERIPVNETPVTGAMAAAVCRHVSPPLLVRGERLGLAVAASAALVVVAAALAAQVLFGRAEAGAELRAAAQDETLYLVDVNRAPWYELSLVPGLGGTLSRRIVEQRPYAALDDLLGERGGVRGIGRIRLEELRPFLTVGPAGAEPRARP
jgi:DNA uptake protein ComE-like DNA-binding protein